MASPKEVMMKVIKPKPTSDGCECIKELISKAFATRNLLHFSHWDTGSYATHMAVGDLYDSIIGIIDDIVETYMGKNGKISGLSTGASSSPNDICAHVKSEASWVESNRSAIACGDTSIENLVDNLISAYHKCVYKLENLS